MVTIRASRPADGDRLLAIWRAAVDASHHFLSPPDRQEIDHEVQQFLPQSALWLAVDETDRPIGFMGLSGSRLESLFIHAAYRGIGVGWALVAHALDRPPTLTVDVNEQNEQAVGFYKRLGFVRIGRSPTDDQGRPYPLVHMRLDATRQPAGFRAPGSASD